MAASRNDFIHMVTQWNHCHSKENFKTLFYNEFENKVNPIIRVVKIFLHTFSGRYKEIEKKGWQAWKVN